MMTLVSTGQISLARSRALLSRCLLALSATPAKLVLLLVLWGAGFAHAQDITMPEVNIDGIDEDSSGDQILIVIIKFVARILLWAMMVIAGMITLKKILSSWNEQKSNDQGRWGAVVGDSIGSIIMLIGTIAICTWLLTFLN